MKPTNSYSPFIFAQVKVHKVGMPLRLITTANITVVMTKDQFSEKFFEQLENTKYYSPAIPNYNPTSKVEAKPKLFLKQLCSQHLITPEQAVKMKPTNSYSPFIFAQVKVHKVGMPLRLITTAKFIPYAALAKLVKPLLKDLSHSDYACSNSIEFVNKLQMHPPPLGTVHFKADVVALFPSISQELMLSDLKEACEANPVLLLKHNLTTECVVQIVDFIFQNTYVRFERNFFFQKGGTPIGGELSSFLTDISLKKFDFYINHLFLIHLYTRYVDDVYNCVQEGKIDEIMSAYNKYHPSIQFTFEFPTEGVLPFLDLALSLQNGCISYSHYQKPTQSNRIIPFSTHSPLSYKLSSLKGESRRIYRNTQDKATLPELYSKVKAKYFHAGYPLHLLDRICDSKWAATPTVKFSKKPYTLFLPYLGQLSEQIVSFCAQYNVQVIPTKTPTLKQLLLQKSEVRTRPSPREYVYALPCSSCSKVYIGQTSRAELRLADHLRDIKAKKSSSAPFCHLKSTGHLPAENRFTPLMYNHHYFSRLNLETCAILILKDHLTNLQIPTHYGLQAWLKYFIRDHPSQIKKVEQFLLKKISDSSKPKPVRQFRIPPFPSSQVARQRV
jgi:hypothetical protein